MLREEMNTLRMKPFAYHETICLLVDLTLILHQSSVRDFFYRDLLLLIWEGFSFAVLCHIFMRFIA